ncbi:hypothetical protein CYMTET_34938 [Cymbomonas tetramitiformis]|uniref:Uncharacterized protein n=1 Tax=Cymbomonas tetramitiformis TaxID=36881 RepID=A0AAE0KPQ3_9CHLO|nr:hypothetical protein CYMTET_34938 [Cymbomonas tetramitiformis]
MVVLSSVGVPAAGTGAATVGHGLSQRKPSRVAAAPSEYMATGEPATPFVPLLVDTYLLSSGHKPAACICLQFVCLPFLLFVFGRLVEGEGTAAWSENAVQTRFVETPSGLPGSFHSRVALELDADSVPHALNFMLVHAATGRWYSQPDEQAFHVALFNADYNAGGPSDDISDDDAAGDSEGKDVVSDPPTASDKQLHQQVDLQAQMKEAVVAPPNAGFLCSFSSR